jgi:hypothetical protein
VVAGLFVGRLLGGRLGRFASEVSEQRDEGALFLADGGEVVRVEGGHVSSMSRKRL